eukprot:TRINITY_DN17674_c0_g1_i1.p1 TRINITY_DN17674_c0_g1~~TRINITY_DN17674_c0_g1_i1.p1  ORF type:complete len:421 (+),score=86.16 TRINITY_DN17674_c0_g1_i1:82-1263(+)
MHAEILWLMSAAASMIANETAICRAAMDKWCNVTDSGLGGVCLECLHGRNQTLFDAGCTNRTIEALKGGFCRCYCTPECDAALRERCPIPADASSIQQCVSCLAASEDYLFARGCVIENLAVHCSRLEGANGSAAPQPAPTHVPGDTADPCFESIAALCGNRSFNRDVCQGCVLGNMPNFPMCSPAQLRAHSSTYCDCHCTPTCSAALRMRCPAWWSDDTSTMVRRCVSCALDPAVRGDFATAGCTDDMLGSYCRFLDIQRPPRPFKPPSPCFTQMERLCNWTSLGDGCLQCIQERKQELEAPKGMCSEEEFEAVRLPFCSCHEEACTPAPTSGVSPPSFFTPQPPLCVVCPEPVPPGKVCCNRTLNEKCHDPSEPFVPTGPCCACGFSKCLC